MSEDIATLGVKVEADGIDETKNKLDALTKSGEKAEGQAKATGGAHKKATDALREGIPHILEVTGAIDKVTEAFSLNRNQIMELGHSGRAIIDMLMAGASPTRALAMESSRLAQVLGEGSGGGSLSNIISKVTGLFNPFTAGLAVAAVAVGAFVIAGKNYADTMQKMEQASTGLARGVGVTGATLEKAAQAAANASKLTINAARDYTIEFASAGISNNQTLIELTKSVEGYASITGMKAAEAAKELAKAMHDPVQASKELEEQLGILTAAQMGEIEALVAAGDKEKAASIISKALSEDIKENAKEATGLTGILNNFIKVLEGVWDWLGRVANGFANGAIAMSRWIDQHHLVNALQFIPVVGQIGAAVVPWLGQQKMDGEGKQGKKTDPQTYELNRITNDLRSKSDNLNLTGIKKYDEWTAGVQEYNKALEIATALNRKLDPDTVHTAKAQRDSLAAITDADGNFLTIQQRHHKMAILELAIHESKNKAVRTELETRRQILATTEQLLTSEERSQIASDKGAIKGASTPHEKKPKKDVVEGELQKLQAEVEGQNLLNAALLQGEGATLKAEAAKAALVALSDKEATASQRSREETLQLELALSKYVGTANKTIETLERKNKVHKALNDNIANGTRSIYEYNRALAIELATGSLDEAQKQASGKTAAQLKTAIFALTAAMNEENVQAERKIVLDGIAANDNNLKMLKAEGDLIGASNIQRAIAIAQIKNEQFLKAHPEAANDPKFEEFKQGNIDTATQAVKNSEKKDQHDFDLHKPIDDFSVFSDSIKNATGDFGKMFGVAGQGFSDLTNIMLDSHSRYLQAQEEKIKINEKYGKDSVRATQEIDKIDKRSKQDQISQYGNLIHAAKGFFAEGTTGYKVMQAAESAYRIFQFAMTIKAMVMDVAHTGTSVANSGTRAAAHGIEAVAKAIASLPFPLNLIAGAATIAFLVGIGVKIAGGGGSGAATAPPKPVELYNGVTDSYGNPTSSQYSVLKPTAGRGVASANDNGVYASNSGSFHMGDTHINIQGDASTQTVEQMRQVLDAHKQETVDAARLAVAADNAASSRRQRIGGA